ncbi:2-amino-4-hydroxy-6-hydroxymethyldihydropteridine diphosphokinase [Helicobacter cetorum]|uniref:2-amino-4-hydroxy-6-hydroxymethyldihydropteridine pyrophosphokinase n=1 Tax=Helicobacter cetorum (strain ATCC BAA-540 / CCUG 52418 / MIT 99-5656) TaxID=1163745 RepID=I0ETG2_HELCM|nr:2-amino-4-hydroxy-6-hydroxymethyldihydropteridine diphosphokinase [Helicobacter cetorum]AFI06231.1 2-amino-4-hydroxy-6-hydroxymethyldihydropteridine pyrophosphokinase [Helicobacter cetorum MIT 99-5656]
MHKILLTHFFPSASKSGVCFSNRVVLGIGGNIKSPLKTLERCYLWLKNHSGIGRLLTSPIYLNPPFGYTQQPTFYNATIVLRTYLSLREFFALVFYIERRFGRKRKRDFKDAPRTLDIDILAFNKVVLNQAYLTLPHPKWHERESVLVPLALQQILFKNGELK